MMPLYTLKAFSNDARTRQIIDNKRFRLAFQQHLSTSCFEEYGYRAE